MRKIAGGKPFVGGLLLALFVFVLAMANSGALHHLVHSEAAQPNHECVVKLLANGLIDFSPVAATVVTPPSSTFVCVLPEVPLLLAADYSLLPSRGPPASLT